MNEKVYLGKVQKIREAMNFGELILGQMYIDEEGDYMIFLGEEETEYSSKLCKGLVLKNGNVPDGGNSLRMVDRASPGQIISFDNNMKIYPVKDIVGV